MEAAKARRILAEEMRRGGWRYVANDLYQDNPRERGPGMNPEPGFHLKDRSR